MSLRILAAPRRTLATAITLLTLVGATGCDSQQLAQERDALWQQNRQLQSEALRSREAARAAEMERNRALEENSALRQQLEQERAQAVALKQVSTTPPVAASNTGLASIRGLDGIEVTETRGAITVRVPGDILFSPGQVTLRSGAMKTLDRIAGELKRSYTSNAIRIEGYTDTDKIKKSKWKDNLQLSMERAAAVHRYLQSKGISNKQMYAAGFGPAKPQSSKTKSRRVEIVVVK